MSKLADPVTVDAIHIYIDVSLSCLVNSLLLM